MKIVAATKSNANEVIVSIPNDEIDFIFNAINETIKELEWEFSIRTGWEIEEAEELKLRLKEAKNDGNMIQLQGASMPLLVMFLMK